MGKVIIRKLSEEQIAEKKIRSWQIWEKEVSRFDWEYDGDEECLILEGEIKVETADGIYNIHPGDFVVFKSGLKCTWDITKPVKKHYNFP